jgi:cytochrome o ubiquinol oxidase subunit II
MFMGRSAARAKAAVRRGHFFCAASRIVALTLAAAALGGCADGVLQPQGPIGSANAKILLDAVGIMAAIVVPTIIAALIIPWWFRASNTRARYQPGFVYSGRLEIIIWSIPIMVIMFLGGVIWIGSHQLDPYTPVDPQKTPLEVQVVSLDWKWLFIYPQQHVGSVNRLVIPVGAPVHFFLTSAAVMNNFFVPQLGSMIALMNGMVSQLYLKADRPGEYYGESAQFSGDGFSGMNFTVQALGADDFAKWVAAAQQAGPALDRAAYAALNHQSQGVAPFTYRTIDATLFDAIVNQELPPGPGPQGGGSSVSTRAEQ